MVCALTPIDSLRGAHKYYIFSKGTYHVGRKDCEIIVQTDTSISRNHAEIVVDKMAPLCVRVIDKSKYGTFISKDSGVKVRLVKNKDATLTEGDLITFGTCNASFRFCSEPIIVHVSKSIQKDSSFQEALSSIGAQSSCNWSPECTHVLVEESSPVTKDLIEAVVSKKPIIHIDWLKALAEKNICTEFPSCMPYAPTLSLDRASIRIVDTNTRDKCLEGFTFVLGSLQKYKFGEKYQSLLEAAGAKFLSTEEFCSDSQTSADGENHYVFVVPGESPNKILQSKELASLSQITDLQLVAAILSGHLDSSILEQPSIIVSSSHSTDETMVADSDLERDTATSDVVAETAKSMYDIKSQLEGEEAKNAEEREDTSKQKTVMKSSIYMTTSLENIEISSMKGSIGLEAKIAEESEDTSKQETAIRSSGYLQTSCENTKTSSMKEEGVASIKKVDKGDECYANKRENSDIIYSQGLIVRDINVPISVQPTATNFVNFKRFRKKETLSGNNFRDLIPFSKDPYKASEYGSNEKEYIREEKKRKQLEAIAEDLFHNEKARKRAAAGASIQSFFTRR